MHSPSHEDASNLDISSDIKPKIKKLKVKSKKVKLKLKPKSTKQYTCEICSEVFNKKKLLFDHMDLNHMDDPAASIVCESCGKTFSSRQTLWKHKETHSREKQLPCNVCNKIFIRQSR